MKGGAARGLVDLQQGRFGTHPCREGWAREGRETGGENRLWGASLMARGDGAVIQFTNEEIEGIGIASTFQSHHSHPTFNTRHHI